MEQRQQQWQGPERRQQDAAYEGENRRRQPPATPVKEPSPDDGTRPSNAQQKKDQTDIH